MAIGRRLAEKLSFRTGDNVTLLHPNGVVTPIGIMPRIKAYKVAAVFEIGMFEYDAAFVFMPLHRGAGLLQPLRRRHRDRGLHHRSRPGRSFPQARIEAAGRPTAIVDWRQLNTTFFGALQVERNVMFLIVTLIVLVAAFNIVSGLIMLVKDKGADIAHPAHDGCDEGRR